MQALPGELLDKAYFLRKLYDNQELKLTER
jgi:hypothetical protein